MVLIIFQNTLPTAQVRTYVHFSNGATQSQAGARGADKQHHFTLIKVRGAAYRATIP